jgi:intein-encoded DNA endonuclease-like protein
MRYNQHTKETFIDKSIKKHGEKYDYSLVDYINSNTKVRINCRIHGVFEQIPNSHLSGRGCEKCSYKLRGENRVNKTYYRKWGLNESFFNLIDDEYKAYFLGLLYADGSINKDKSITLGLHKQDINILIKFNDILGYKKPLKYHEGVNNNMVVVVINSHQMYNDLIDKGCVNKKTFKLVFPSEKIVPKHLIRHFIRGYFDGDGCMYIAKKSYNNYANFLSTHDFLMGLGDYIGLKYHLRQKDNIWSLFYRTKDRLLILKDFLYENSNIYFKRKKDKFDLV